MIVQILNKSPLNGLLDVGDIIIEVQKNSINLAKDLDRLVENVTKKGQKTLLLTVINKNNQRRYLGVKIK